MPVALAFPDRMIHQLVLEELPMGIGVRSFPRQLSSICPRCSRVTSILVLSLESALFACVMMEGLREHHRGLGRLHIVFTLRAVQKHSQDTGELDVAFHAALHAVAGAKPVERMKQASTGDAPTVLQTLTQDVSGALHPRVLRQGRARPRLRYHVQVFFRHFCWVKPDLLALIPIRVALQQISQAPRARRRGSHMLCGIRYRCLCLPILSCSTLGGDLHRSRS
mmetsp:Transcript_19789/g.74826  ORF Transcript_19789/g.74826 Transcript_19789/m.74826 type:complete len:223 (+) Transcript_19789:431-1099(+)